MTLSLNSSHPESVLTDSRELQILNYLSAEPMRSDPRNRTIPILDVFLHSEDPRYTFFVMPYMRRFHYPPFHCRGEFLEAMRQFLEVNPTHFVAPSLIPT